MGRACERRKRRYAICFRTIGSISEVKFKLEKKIERDTVVLEYCNLSGVWFLLEKKVRDDICSTTVVSISG